MEPLIISVSGLRGVVGESLTPVVAARYIGAFARTLPPGPVIVSQDGRSSGAMFRDAICATLVACGRQVWVAGAAATPTVGILVRQLGAAGAVQISASHNPAPYNGIKLFGGDGRVLPAGAGAAVRDDYLADRAAWQPVTALGAVTTIDDPHAAHLERVIATVDRARIAALRFQVLLDSNHGAGGNLGRRLLEALGCRVVAVGAEPTGNFAHLPEPLAENLQEIGHRVRAEGCVVGFCQDPDADRLAVIDEQGTYIGEELTLALCLQQALAQQSGPVVINCATSSVNERVAERFSAPVTRSAVGEANVVDEMIAQRAVFGGEGNGGPIDPRIGYVRDSFVGMARILDLMARSGQSISQLVAQLPRLVIRKHKLSLSAERLPQAMRAVEDAFQAATVSKQDGLRLAWPDRWLLVRGSNTEPIVRLIAEAATEQEADALCQTAAAAIERA
jgi:phosphomannomutase